MKNVEKQLFDKWNAKKQEINLNINQKKLAIFHERDVWWVSIGLNIGKEIYGKSNVFSRPVLVFKKFSSRLFIGIPLSSKVLKGTWFMTINILGKRRTALLYQLRLFDSLRLYSKIDKISDVDFTEVKEKTGSLLGFFKFSREFPLDH